MGDIAAATTEKFVESKADLMAYLEAGNKPIEAWRIGTEHEKFGYQMDNLRPLPYKGAAGVEAMLTGLQRFGWQPQFEDENVIALLKNGASITLEPGGQFELSGAPLDNLHQTCQEVHTHLDQVKEVALEIGAGFLGLGFNPKWGIEDTPIMPKGRYKIMRAYMPTRGDHGRDMMFRSSTVQVNLDFSSEADMVQKFRTALALQPIATALFANSPFNNGQITDYLSYRSFVWTDTDPDRCGMLPFVFEDGFGFERWTDYILDVPMYFLYRSGVYQDASGLSFRDLMAGKLPGFEGERATLKDWEDHLTTAFPEVRLKQFLEMRGADGGPWNRLCALPAFWVGLLYDQDALDAASDIIKTWTEADRMALRAEAPKQALKAKIAGQSVGDVALEVLKIADLGLKNRARAGVFTDDEAEFLKPLWKIAKSGETLAEEMLAKFKGEWGGSVDPIYQEYAY